MTRGYRSWFQDLINVWTMPATMLKKSYVQAIHSQCRFCKLKMLYMCFFTFRTRLVDRRFQKTEAAGSWYTISIFHVVVADYVWGLDLYENVNSTQQRRKRDTKNAK